MSYSQESAVILESEKKTYTFINKPYPDSLEYNTSLIIQEIALANNQHKSDVKFSMNFTLQSKITGDKLLIRIKPQSIAGNTRYRDFSTGNMLYPSHVRLRLSLQKGRYVMNRYELPAVPVSSGEQGEWMQLDVEEALSDETNVKFSDISFYFDEQTKEKILSYFEMINDYYGSSKVLDSLIQLSFKYKLDRESCLPENTDFMLILLKAEQLLKSKKFLDILPISLYDPDAYQSKLSLFERRINRVRTLTIELLEETRYQSFATESMFREFNKLYELFLHWSVSANHYYQQSFYALIEQSMSVDDFEYHSLLYDMPANELACHFVEEMLVLNDQFLQSQQYSVAFDLLNALQKLVAEVPACRVIPALKQKRSQSASKLYDSYLRVAERAIQHKNFDFGLAYLGKAQKFLNHYASLVKDGNRLLQIKKLLADQYYDEMNIYLSHADYMQARQTIRKLQILLRENQKLEIAEFDYHASMEKINKGLSLEYLTTASRFFNRNEYDKARQYLQKADSLKSENRGNPQMKAEAEKSMNSYTLQENLTSKGISELNKKEYREARRLFKAASKQHLPDHLQVQLDSLIILASTNLIEQNIKIIKVAIFQGRLDFARSLLNEIDQLRATLPENSADLKEIEKIRAELKGSGCEDYWRKYEQNTLLAFKSIDSNRYIQAEQYFKNAMDVMDELEMCGISDSIALKVSKRYHPAAQYQKLYEALKIKLFREGFTAVIELFISLDSLYTRHKLSELDVPRHTLLRFLANQNNPVLYLNTIHHLNKNSNCHKAIEVYAKLIASSYPCSKTKKIQKEMAEVCYESDKSKGEDFIPDEDLEMHMRQCDCLHHFKRRYQYLYNKDGFISIFSKEKESGKDE